jgi:hypothetical protein
LLVTSYWNVRESQMFVKMVWDEQVEKLYIHTRISAYFISILGTIVDPEMKCLFHSLKLVKYVIFKPRTKVNEFSNTIAFFI